MKCSPYSSVPSKLPTLHCSVLKERETTRSPADNQEPWLRQPKTILDVPGDISKAVDYLIALLVLDQPKYLLKMIVNTGINNSLGAGSSTKNQARPP